MTMLIQQPGISNHGVNHRTLRQRFWGIKTLMLGDAKLGTNLGVDYIYYVPRVGRWWHVAVPRIPRLSYCTQPISTLNPFSRLHRSIPILFPSTAILQFVQFILLLMISAPVSDDSLLKIQTLGLCLFTQGAIAYNCPTNSLCLLTQNTFPPNTWSFRREANGYSGGLGIQFPFHPYK